ncbi:hypothetical protein SADUNF_Sadunf16G0127500 [Salix dunnii]|uniref:RING-type E3 ubiquitin transferase n=1 Tax=Salix dunnii TaxID=1413687 RepID=A0A835JBC7_9ROSI|nr:hypothetical protein SADUNF_Sadunf16G0127500 [Salix dunnii]
MSSSPTPSPGHEFEQQSHRNPFVLVSLAVVCIIIILLLIFSKIIKRICCAVVSVDGDINKVIFENPSMQFQIHGLEPFITYSLPIAQFKNKNGDEASPSDNECAVCMSEFEDGEWLEHLPNCCHIFHIFCIDTWFRSHTNCPLCRSHFFNLSLYRSNHPQDSEQSLITSLSLPKAAIMPSYRDVEIVIPVDAVKKAEIRCSCLDLNKTRNINKSHGSLGGWVVGIKLLKHVMMKQLLKPNTETSLANYFNRLVNIVGQQS